MGTDQATDVLIAGGGPAGLAAAIASRLAGLDVVVADPKRPPIDKACGEGLMPDGAELLSRLGVVLPPGESHALLGISFIEGGLRARARFRRRPGVAVRRATLHAALAARAGSLGARILWGSTARVERTGPARIDGEPVDARWIIGADGPDSRVRRAMGLEAPPRFRRLGLRRHYRLRPWSGFVEVHWSERCEAYVTPVDPQAVNVAVLLRDSSLGFDEAMASFPGLRDRLDPAAAAGDERGAFYVERRLARVARGATALIGDASGSVDAVTGLGVTLALHQAVLLARSLRQGDLAIYEASHRDLSRLAHGMSRLLELMERRHAVRRASLRALAALPGLFPALLRLHTRDLPGLCPGGLAVRLHDLGRDLPTGAPAA